MITSRFYLIKGDDKPIYVGFTNRTLKQRFAEHKADKDFSQFDKVTIEQLDKLEYNFTWDEDVLYKNANEVSVREAQLVEKYGTQDSPYQKAVGGGTVWAYEKWFVSCNKDTPKFLGMTEQEIANYIQNEYDINIFMKDFVHSMREPIEVFMGNFVTVMHDSVDSFMTKFVMSMNKTEDVFMSHFISTCRTL